MPLFRTLAATAVLAVTLIGPAAAGSYAFGLVKEAPSRALETGRGPYIDSGYPTSPAYTGYQPREFGDSRAGGYGRPLSAPRFAR